MSTTFLSNFMRLALQYTGAERGMACDAELAIVDTLNLEQVDLLSDNFMGIETLRRAYEKGEPIITNNAVMDPAMAPNTNTNFTNLRVIVVIPALPYGGIYVDQPIRRGIISKEIVNRLMMLASYAIENEYTEISEAQLGQLYEQMG